MKKETKSATTSHTPSKRSIGDWSCVKKLKPYTGPGVPVEAAAATSSSNRNRHEAAEFLVSDDDDGVDITWKGETFSQWPVKVAIVGYDRTLRGQPVGASKPGLPVEAQAQLGCKGFDIA